MPSSGNDSNTVLLLHADGTEASTTFIDSSSGAKTVTAVGNAKIHTSKFSSQAGFFDGTGDYLTVPDHADWDFGTGDFCLEGFFRFRAISQVYLFNRSAAANDCDIIINSSTNIGVYIMGALVISATITALVTDTWYHIASVRNSGTVTLYVNGVSVGTVANSVNISSANLYAIGASAAGALGVNGWIDEVRFSKVARYTSGFTPSTTEFVSDANTVLLLHFNDTLNGTTFTDSENTPKTVTANGNAKISGVTRFGTGSAAFDGTGDYLAIPDSPDWDFGTGDFTIDFWIRFAGHSGADYMVTRGANVTDVNYSAGLLYLNIAGVSHSASWSPSLNTWYHVAGVRSSGTWRLFVDGTQLGSGADSNSISTADAFSVGGSSNYASFWVNGWMDEVRISNNARWTSNFTPETTPYGQAGAGLNQAIII